MNTPDTDRSERDKMLAGELYDASDPELLALRLQASRLCMEINASIGDALLRRTLLLRLLGPAAETCTVTSPFLCDYGSNITLGEKVYFNFNCVILDVCSVTIGSFTLFGPGVHIYTALHPFDAALRRVQEYGRPVVIGSDVWVGGGAMILPGVRIGDGAVIGAGSVVTRDVPAGVFAAGNPCRVIRSLAAGDKG